MMPDYIDLATSCDADDPADGPVIPEDVDAVIPDDAAPGSGCLISP